MYNLSLGFIFLFIAGPVVLRGDESEFQTNHSASEIDNVLFWDCRNRNIKKEKRNANIQFFGASRYGKYYELDPGNGYFNFNLEDNQLKKLGENWFVDAPWAQLLCSTKIPDDILQNFIQMSEEVLQESVQMWLAGNGKGTDEVVPSSWEVTVETFQKHGVLDYTMQKINDFLNTVLSNGNVKQMMDTEIPNGPHTQWNSRIVHAWVVSQKENDYLPVHAHSEMVEFPSHRQSESNLQGFKMLLNKYVSLGCFKIRTLGPIRLFLWNLILL